MAAAAGIKKAIWTVTLAEFQQAIWEALKGDGMTFIGAKVELSRAEVPPFPMDEVENKYRFIRYIEKTEKINILQKSLPASYS